MDGYDRVGCVLAEPADVGDYRGGQGRLFVWAGEKLQLQSTSNFARGYIKISILNFRLSIFSITAA